MKIKGANIITGLLIAGFIGFLIFASTRVSLNFDASYNMLPYQSLFNGTGFNYTYNEKIVPFNPPVSTGPELYAPAFVIWKLMGRVNYYAAIYVLIGYYLLFFIFTSLLVFKKSGARLLFTTGFMVAFFCNQKIFEHWLFIDPLGEVIASLLVFAGLYLLDQKRFILSFLLFGLALDVKFNIIVALLPMLAIFLWIKYFYPLLKKKEYRGLLKTAGKFAALAFIILAPYLTYTKLTPAIVLNPQEKRILKEAQVDWMYHQATRAFGHLIMLKKDGDLDQPSYLELLGEKIMTLKAFFRNNWGLLLLFLISIPLLMIQAFRARHFSFYLFIFAIFFMLWWLLMAVDIWYRYFFLTEFTYILGIAALLPTLARNRKNRLAALTLMLVGLVIVTQISFSMIGKRLDKTKREDLMKMREEVAGLPAKNVFTYDWFQCPQIMLMNNVRFLDYADEEKLARAKKRAKESGEQLYFLTSPENTLIKEQMRKVTRDLILVKEFGFNSLYLIP